MKMWIGRNEDGTLVLFKTKPMCFYEEGGGHYWAGHALYLPRNEFPSVTFENSPMEVELINKNGFDSLIEAKEKYEEFLGIVEEMRSLQKEQDKWNDTSYYESLHKRMVGLQKEVDQWLNLN